MTEIPKKILARQKEITSDFLKIVDDNLADVLSGKSEEIYEIRDVAEKMHIHPRHLSNTIKLVTGNSPCSFVEDKILDVISGRKQNEHCRNCKNSDLRPFKFYQIF